MQIKKRNGKYEDVSFDKILRRVKSIGHEHNLTIPYSTLVIKVIDQLYDNINTSLIDELTAQQCAAMSTQNIEYDILAGAITVSNLHKETDSSFYNVVKKLYDFRDINDEKAPIINEKFMTIVRNNKEFLNSIIDYKRDYLIDYFGMKTLEKSYLLRLNGKVIERPQHMWLRVAICIHENNMEQVKETYDLMSQKYFTHATPTLFNAGTNNQQLSSCYLIAMEDDSVDGIFNTLKECAQISKWSGGIGLHIHNIRATGSHIRGTNGQANGIVPMLGVFNKTARFINQGGKRAGSFAIYIEPHHADIELFLDLKKNHGDEELRSRDLFYALWISDLFMERVFRDEIWSLFCPDSVPTLSNVYGDEYTQLYLKYEVEKKYTRQVNARDIWIKILDSQMETGTPYMLYKDACNKKSNQQNLGTIKSSNLCSEVVLYSDKDQTAVCNLASIGLSKFVNETSSPFGDTSVKIYTKNNCSLSILLKSLLKRKNIVYREITIDAIEEFKNHKEFDDHKKIDNHMERLPLLFTNDKLIGGYTECLDILRNTFDYEKLHQVVKTITNNLDKVIDINFYPTEKTKRSNLLHRPIGIGVQGLADVFILMDLPFVSDEAKKINRLIFETIYHAALEKSCRLSRDRIEYVDYLRSEFLHNDWNFNDTTDISTIYTVYNNTCASSINTETTDIKTIDCLKAISPIRSEICKERKKNHYGAYSSFEGSPASNGILQFDMWNVDPGLERYDWTSLKNDIKEYGIRNSVLISPMPTASTSQILGNNECFEPYTSNIYTRRTLAGEYILLNRHLMKELISLDMWNEAIKNNIIANKGSVQYILGLPDIIKNKYKTVWEIPMKHLIDMSRDRGAFVCQSQSLNLWLEDPDVKTLTNMHFYSWRAGLKTGIYYLRRKAKHQPQQFTIEPEKNHKSDDTFCEMCSS